MNQRVTDPALVVIPARMASVRLPDKPLADVHGQPMIVHVWRRAKEADVGPVLVAAAEQTIVDVVEGAGGQAILTDPNHPSGSDRVWEAVETYDPDGRYEKIINLQGDLPTMDAEQIRFVLDLLRPGSVDISTLAAEITEAYEREGLAWSRRWSPCHQALGRAEAFILPALQPLRAKGRCITISASMGTGAQRWSVL